VQVLEDLERQLGIGKGVMDDHVGRIAADCRLETDCVMQGSA
jgi:hypothetical protein